MIDVHCIDADALETHEQLEPMGNGMYEYVQVVYKDDIDNAPTIEPEHKTGKWLLITDNNGQHYICDHCGAWKYHQHQKFCGECGLKMEEGEQE